jgi:hypothetical protein
LHNNIRERTKVFRGFKSIKSANAIMQGYAIFHNFIKQHQALGKCPYELVYPNMRLEGNKWLGLIKLSNN